MRPGYMPLDSSGFADSIRRSGDRRAELEMLRGQNAQQLVGGLANAATGLVQARAEQQQKQGLKRQDQAFVALLEDAHAQGRQLTDRDFVRIYGPQRGLDLYKGYHASLDPQKQLSPDEVAAFGAASPEVFATVFPDLRKRSSVPLPEDPTQAHALLKDMRKKPSGTREVKVRNADGSETIRIVPDEAGAEFTSAPPEPKRHMVTVPGPNGQPMQRLATEEELAQGVQAYSAPTNTEAEPLVAIMRDGKPVYVPRSQAVGQTPASNREQGRPVTSGDANTIAEINTSIGDVASLKNTLGENGSTGFMAKLGTYVPNLVTEYTGIGAEAKQKQADIDRIKQVIGKTMEGGVLKLEDEKKYEKILPTIGDPPPLVKQKLAGLDKALRARGVTLIEALGDAGYDVDAFQARASVTGAVPKADPLGIR